MSAQNPRLLAALCLLDVEEGGYSNLVFKRRAPGAELEHRDLRFAAALFYGTLERKLTLDYILGKNLTRSPDKLDREVLAALRCGLYQCLYMDAVPVSAAVDESVKLCRTLKKSSAAPLVNAVLRRAGAFDLREIANIKDEDARRTVQFSMCAPLAAMISEQYGPLSEEIMNAFFARPKNCARVNTIKTTGSRVAEKLAALGIAARPGEHADSLIIDGEGWLDSSPFRDGSLRLQSAAAQLAVHALKSKPGMSVLDMCAAPGGKTLTCAQIMDNTGRIVALDRSENRLKLLEKQALLEGVSIVETKCADASTYDDGELYDRVLCDVPCSGYGEISSKPELRYKPPAKDSSLWETQRAILERGADRVKPGGMLVYSTCTLDCRENEDVSQEFEARQSNFRVIVADSGEKYSKIIPTADDPEGFFVVTFERMC